MLCHPLRHLGLLVLSAKVASTGDSQISLWNNVTQIAQEKVEWLHETLGTQYSHSFFEGREASASCKNVRILKAVPQGFTKPLDLALVALYNHVKTTAANSASKLNKSRGTSGLVSYLSKSAA